MNLTALQDLLKRYGFDDSDPLTEWINAALHEIEVAYPWPFLISKTTIALSAADTTPALPADFDKVVTLRIDNSKLSYVDPRALDRDWTLYSGSGAPSIYTIVDGILYVYPSPDTAYTIEFLYLRNIVELAAGADVPDIPAKLHYTVVLGAAYIALQAENEEERAQTAFAEFERSLARNWARLGTENQDEPGQVVNVMGY